MKKRGVTLIELLITLSMIGFIGAVITSVYMTGFKTFKEEMASSMVQSNAQTILDAMTTDIKNGLQIEPEYTSDSGITYKTLDEASGEEASIIIRIPAIDNDQKILYSGSTMLFDRVIYYYDNNSIHKVIYANPSSSRSAKSGYDVILDSKVLVLTFAFEPDATSATLVTATISSNIAVSGNRTRSITITGQARLRNHI
jgi:prepilin-type N-terminal cleavage/methylation domain-containing protein